MRWATGVFAIVLAGITIWILDAPGGLPGGLLAWVALVSLGAGWLLAYYMWHVNYAAAHAWDPVVTLKPGNEKDRDV